MKKTIQFNAKCRQCIHYEILNDEKTLKSVLRDAGIFNTRIV